MQCLLPIENDFSHLCVGKVRLKQVGVLLKVTRRSKLGRRKRFRRFEKYTLVRRHKRWLRSQNELFILELLRFNVNGGRPLKTHVIVGI
jgi:hypothetical protein